MFKNVLVGVDGSANGRDAVALAERLLDADGKMTLAHVHPGTLHPFQAHTAALLAEQAAASAELLAEQRAATGVSAELLSVVASSPGGGLHRQAEEQHADLIVVGSCGRTTFGRAMMGDDARGALNGAPCAVAIAMRGYAQRPEPFAKVGVGYNDSPESKAALAVARRVAEPARASVHVLEVVSIPTYAYAGMAPPAIGAGIDTLVGEANARLKQLPDVAARAVYGLTGEELAAFSDELDLLVVGSRSYGPVRRLVLGSTSDYMERHSRCSLLVLPRTALTAAEEARDGEGAGSPAAAETTGR